MLNTELPNIVDPIRFTRQQRYVEGEIPLERFLILSGDLRATGTPVWVKVVGKPTERHMPAHLHFELKADLEVCCQRCMEPLKVLVKEHFDVVPVTTIEQESRLPEGVMPWWVEEEGISLWTQVEEALVVALPLSPRHPEGTCDLPIKGIISSEEEHAAKEETKNPFAGLAGKISIKVE